MANTAATLGTDARIALAKALNQSVADTTVTTMMAQNFHWNVRGMSFGPLHTLFQEIYEDHFVAQDDLAERIRALDSHAEGTLAGILSRSKINEHEGSATDVEMIEKLKGAQETVAHTLAETAELAAEIGDTLTEDLCIARGQVHEKFAWMLRSHLNS